MDTCLNIEALRKQLIADINGSNLTIGAAMLVVKDVYNVIYLSYLDEIEREKNNRYTTHQESTEVLFEKPVEVEEIEEDECHD